MPHRAQLEAVGERAADDAREVKRPIRSGNRQAAAIDGHDTLHLGRRPAARDRGGPCGTTLSDTDGALTSHRVTAAAAPRLVTSK